MTLKILNLYAGIGGNRKLWKGDIEVTAIEIDPKIAKIYQDFFPNDKVIVTDAHQYLLEHFKEFDFIWSSPPCPSHSRFRLLWSGEPNKVNNRTTGQSFKFPDMKLYEEIIFLKYFFKGKYVVENVISYYKPLIEPVEMESHYFWTNFMITKRKRVVRNIRRNNQRNFKKWGFDLTNLNFAPRIKQQILNNLIQPKLALDIFNMAFKEPQKTLT